MPHNRVLAAGMLVHEGGDVENLAVDHDPAIFLGVVTSNLQVYHRAIGYKRLGATTSSAVKLLLMFENTGGDGKN